MSNFKPNRKFKRKYNKLFKKEPLKANTFLLLCELANEKGEVMTDPEELLSLLVARFNDPCQEYALPGVPDEPADPWRQLYYCKKTF